jgi:hypothetical protein
MLLLHLRHVSRGGGKSDLQILAEAKASIVPTLVVDATDRQFRPLWKLRGDQSADKRRLDVAPVIRVIAG